MMTLETDTDFKILFLGFLSGEEHAANARTVHGYRFFHENVLALFDRFFEVDGTEPRGGSEDDHVGLSNGVFIGIEADKDVFGLNIDAFLVASLEQVQRTVGGAFESIGNRHDFDAFTTRNQGLVGSACAAAATANDSDLNGVPRGGTEGKTLHWQGCKETSTGQCGGGGFEKAATRERCLIGFLLVHVDVWLNSLISTS
jgi:hypothetical protein